MVKLQTETSLSRQQSGRGLLRISGISDQKSRLILRMDAYTVLSVLLQRVSVNTQANTIAHLLALVNGIIRYTKENVISFRNGAVGVFPTSYARQIIVKSSSPPPKLPFMPDGALYKYAAPYAPKLQSVWYSTRTDDPYWLFEFSYPYRDTVRRVEAVVVIHKATLDDDGKKNIVTDIEMRGMTTWVDVDGFTVLTRPKSYLHAPRANNGILKTEFDDDVNVVEDDVSF